MKNKITFVVCSFAMCTLMLATTHATNVVVIDDGVTPKQETLSTLEYTPLIDFSVTVDIAFLKPESLFIGKQYSAIADFVNAKPVKQFDLVTHPLISKHLFNYSNNI